jgi:hypothetical protein
VVQKDLLRDGGLVFRDMPLRGRMTDGLFGLIFFLVRSDERILKKELAKISMDSVMSEGTSERDR